jgi:hypothetical protein
VHANLPWLLDPDALGEGGGGDGVGFREGEGEGEAAGGSWSSCPSCTHLLNSTLFSAYLQRGRKINFPQYCAGCTLSAFDK